MAKKITQHQDRYGYEQTAVREDGRFDEKDARAVAAGATLGGEKPRRPKSVKLADFAKIPEDFAELHARRRQELAEAGYVPPVELVDPLNPRSTKGIDIWHGMAAMAAEGQKGKSYALMGDTFAAGEGSTGRGLDGRRRNPRMKYEPGNGVTLRMYSVSAVRRFAKANGHETFDMPVEATTRRGDRKFFGHVRVTMTPEGRVIVNPPQGMEGDENELNTVCEAVAAQLEGRRSPVADKAKRDLLAERAQRLASYGVGTVDGPQYGDGKQHFIRQRGYNPYSRQLVVSMFSKKENREIDYVYDLSKDKNSGRELSQSESDYYARQIFQDEGVGSAYANGIKKMFESARADRCDTCGRVAVGAHQCPVAETEARRGQNAGRAQVLRVGAGWKTVKAAKGRV